MRGRCQAPRKFSCRAGGLLLFVLRPCVIVQWEQSFPISPQFPGCAAVAAPAGGFTRGDSSMRTDWAARARPRRRDPHLALPRWSPSPERAETARWGERWRNKTLNRPTSSRVAFPAELSKPLRPGMAAPFSWLPKLSLLGRPSGRGDGGGGGGDVWPSANSPGAPRNFKPFRRQLPYSCFYSAGFELRSPRNLNVQPNKIRDWKLRFGTFWHRTCSSI